MGLQQDRRQAPVAPGKHPLQPGLGRRVPLGLDVFLAQPVLDAVEPAAALLQILLALPLKRGVRLGDEAGEADVEPRAAAPGGGGQNLPGQGRDGLPVGQGLPGQADHEVELEELPAGGEGPMGRIHDGRLGEVLVDDLAQALAARLRSQGQPGAPHPLNLRHHVRGEGVGAHGRQRNRHLRRGQSVHQGLEQSGQGAIVADAEAQQGDLFEAGGSQGFLHPGQRRGRVPLPDRPVNHAGLAVTAAPGAAPGNLQTEAVVDNLTGRDQGEGRNGYPVQIIQDPLGHDTPAALGDDGL